MKSYLKSADAVNDLHSKGFIHDFRISGNDLFWIQEDFLIRAGEFCILEYHTIKADDKNKATGIVVIGIIAMDHDIKGILITHCENVAGIEPPVLLKKLKELNKMAGSL